METRQCCEIFRGNAFDFGRQVVSQVTLFRKISNSDCTFDDEKKCFRYYFVAILHTNLSRKRFPFFARLARVSYEFMHLKSKVLQKCLHVRFYLPNRLTILLKGLKKRFIN